MTMEDHLWPKFGAEETKSCACPGLSVTTRSKWILAFEKIYQYEIGNFALFFTFCRIGSRVFATISLAFPGPDLGLTKINTLLFECEILRLFRRSSWASLQVFTSANLHWRAEKTANLRPKVANFLFNIPKLELFWLDFSSIFNARSLVSTSTSPLAVVLLTLW